MFTAVRGLKPTATIVVSLREMGRKCPNSRAGSSDPESWIHFPTTRLRVHADRTGDQRRIDGDDCQVSYFLEQDPQTGKMSLWRRRNPTIGLDPFSGGDREEIASGVLGLRLEYYDGLDWFDTWGDSEGRGKQQYSLLQRSNLYGLPDAVRITMSFDPNPRPTTSANATTNEPALVFRTVARVNLSAALQRSSSPGSGRATEAGGQTTAGPGGGN